MEPTSVSHHAGGSPGRGPGQGESGLVARAQQGDLGAFDRLVLTHQEQVFAVAFRMLGDREDAKEIAQDAFVRAYRALGTFRGEAKFSTWLLTITTNLCRNRRRWWARRKRVIAGSLDEPIDTEEGSLMQQVEDPSPTPEAQAMNAELGQQMADALALLDPPHRAVVVLRDIEGLSYEEITQVLRCEIGTVKSRLSRARNQLKALLDGKL